MTIIAGILFGLTVLLWVAMLIVIWSMKANLRRLQEHLREVRQFAREVDRKRDEFRSEREREKFVKEGY